MIDKSILKELKEALEKCTPGEWTWTTFCRPNGEDITELEHVKEALSRSANDGKPELWGITCTEKDSEGLYKVVGYTGNGPTSTNNSNFIALAHNHMLSLLNSYEEMEKERDELASFKVNMLHAAKLDHELYESRKQTVRTLADALRNAIDELGHSGYCYDHPSLERKRAALSDPIVKQILEEK